MLRFRSIRWRLVAGFTLLTLLTVTLLGILVLSLMQRYVVRQETAYLYQNATALAQQSEQFLTAAARPAELISLAQTASLLGNFRVRILDTNEDILVDSDIPLAREPITWVFADADRGPLLDTSTANGAMGEVDLFVVEGGTALNQWQAQIDGGLVVPPVPALPAKLPTPSVLRIIRQSRGTWGPLLHFDIAAGADEQSARRAVLTSVPLSRTVTAAVPASVALAATEATAREPIHFRDRPLAALLDRLLPFPQRPRVVTPIQQATDVVGYVELSSTPGVAADALAALRHLFLLAAAGVSVVAVTVGLVMSRGLTAPLQTLTVATTHMNEGNLSARAQIHGDDEIGQLARSFNRMADALETSFTELAAERDALRHFVADASHELRTPITALRTFTELLQTGAANDPVAQAEFLAESGLQVQRLERITENLLNLSRLDGGLVELQLEDVPLEELIPPVIELLRPLALDREVALAIAPLADDLIVRGDRQQLERALTNLVENALKFTPAGGHVQVGARAADGGGVELWVQDNGIGIAPAEQTAIFRRFYRGQNATNGGSGLGLAIVQSIVQAHGGRVLVTSQEGEGSRFVLTL
jgi:signal transduction histidine kinase